MKICLVKQVSIKAVGSYACKLDLILFCHFLYVYISCNCLTRCQNSSTAVALEEILAKIFPAVQGVCNCTYSTREDYFSGNQAKERCGVWSSESSLGHSKRTVAAITAAAGSGLWVGLSARVGSENFIQDT